MKSNRKILLINPPFQLSIIGQFALLAMAIAVVYYASTAYFFMQMSEQAQAAGLAPNHVFYRFIDEQRVLLNKIFIGSTGLAIVMTILGGLWLSHRVAGPLHRLVQYLRTQRPASDSANLEFRKGDYFPEIEAAMNEFIKK